MENFTKFTVEGDSRVELHDKLNLTGAEISINVLPAGASVPFVHSHKQNEEIYAVCDGKGYVVIDNRKFELRVGDWVRVSPAAKRQFFASPDCPIKFVCIQVKENSLGNYTATDAIVQIGLGQSE